MAANDDVWVIAKVLVQKHGAEAPVYAKRQALKAQAKSEPTRAEAWRTIAVAAERVLQTGGEVEDE
jgi:hypothetical protein